MALKRLPNEVQSLLCASARLNSYKRVIEELIYNSLDAKSTSIAIRIQIQECTVQVIDNGNGITRHDFNVIGQRHVTSKVTNVATLKAAPKNYGFRGEFLANIITVSQMVKVTSRHDSSEDTWAKTFINGRETKFTQMTTRPTKGTTVDIKGFLYNLNIQKRGIDSISELQNIKSFLEQLSLVHNHISLSLRDDSQNEIVYKIHKKRDIYQTLSTLFSIDKLDVLELQVEKDEYKVKGYIGKTDKNIDSHWIYLNGKFMQNCSKLHKVLNEYFKKSLHIKHQRALKSKKHNNDEHQLFNQNIPFYFVFITCPYIDYDISYTPKQSVVEFKKWEQINKMLEKLVKFYAGDINLKEIKKIEDRVVNHEQTNNKVNQDTRDQVKKIMEKILGSNSKKLGVSQLQNGIKGKMVKRKVKKKTKPSVVIPKLFLQKNKKCNNDEHALTKRKAELSFKLNNEQHVNQQTVDDLDKRKEHKTLGNTKNINKQIKVIGPEPKKHKTKVTSKHKKTLKANILSPAKKKDKTIMKRKHTLNKQKKVKVHKNEFKYLQSTDTVCKRSKIVAQEIEDFLQYHTKKKHVNKHQMENAKNKSRIKNTMVLQKKNVAINDNKLLLLKTNKNIIEKYIMNKLKTKSYKTTYDLVQTVLNSQQDILNAAEYNISEEFYTNYHKRNNRLRCISKMPKQYTWTNKYNSNEYSSDNVRKERSQHLADNSAEHKTYEYEENFSIYEQNNNMSNIITNASERLELINTKENIYNQNRNYCYTQKDTFYSSLTGPLRVLTYNSHQYHQNEVFIRNNIENCHANNKNQNIRFITKESRDNFVTSNDFMNRFKKSFKSVSKKQGKIIDVLMKQTIDESLYTIEYSKSNENNYNTAHDNLLPNCVNFKRDKDYYNHTIVNNEPVIPMNDFNTVFGNTYTIHASNCSFDKQSSTENHIQTRQNIQSTKQFDSHSVHDSHSEVIDDNNESKTTKDNKLNIVFVSKSQGLQDNNMIIEPLNVCETVFYEIGSNEKEFEVSFNENNRFNDSLYDNFGNIDVGIDEHGEDEHAKITRINDDNITENVSHHFSCAEKPIQVHYIDNFQDPMPIENNEIENTNHIVRTKDLPNRQMVPNGTESNINAENIDCNFEINFNLKNRPRFMPKGMSQIFENCRTKTACDYNMDKDYFEDSIYNNFANDVQVNSEIYEPIIQNVEDLTTKDIHKFQNKVKKDNASLVFDETSLKEAKVLGQADCKFIVAIMKNRCGQSKEESEYLILFDQHAVHERIRLEKNLADYLDEEIWTSVAVDNIILKMSKDQILYLHNYKDKFIQLGLQWTILNDNEVTVHCIPEAILGKNPREVEKVIKAVRNLIIEEIKVIKMQKGCLSLYPKSIMDLVFSESCRYAIKFGDPLSKSDCVELLSALSKCKTPFQCAHGRPVMAVIMGVIPDKREYKINMKVLSRFRQRIRSNL